MPHTNRARRADHYRSIAAAADGPASYESKTYGGVGDAQSKDGIVRSRLRQHEAGRADDGGRASASSAVRRKDSNSGRDSSTPARKSFKNQLRSYKRLMSREGLDEEQRSYLQAKVKELEDVVEDGEQRTRERKLAIRYHRFKFFDRRRALRQLAQIHKKLQTDLDKAARAELESLRAAAEMDLKYTVYFPKDRKYVQVRRGKDGSPRSKRAFERLLEEALARGQAEGWVEFQSNIDKFVTSSGGARAWAAEEAVDGQSAGMKRKRGNTGASPVVAQTQPWEVDGEDAGDGGGDGDGDVAGEDGDSGDVDGDDDDAEDSEDGDGEDDEDEHGGDLEKDGEDEDGDDEDDKEGDDDEDDGSSEEERGTSAVVSGTGDAETTQSSSGEINNGVVLGEGSDGDAMPELKDDFFLEEKGSDDGQNADDAATPQGFQGRKRSFGGEGERSGRGRGGRGGRQGAREDGHRGGRGGRQGAREDGRRGGRGGRQGAREDGRRGGRGGRAQMGGRGYQSNRGGKFEDLRGRGVGGVRGRSDVMRGGRGNGSSRGIAANGTRGGRRGTGRGRGGLLRGGRSSPAEGVRRNKKTRFDDSEED